MPLNTRLGANLVGGVAVGVIMATLASIYVLVVSGLRGSLYFERYDMGAGRIILTYYLAGAGGGAIVGILRPLTRWRLGSMFVGVLAR